MSPIIILNPFSGSLAISSSFIWTSVFLICSFPCVGNFSAFSSLFDLVHLRSPFPRHQGKGLPSWLCGLHLQLVELVGRLCVFFLSHAAPGFQMWCYSQLCGLSTGACSWGCPGGLGSAPWGPGVEVVQLLVTGVLAAPGAQGSWRLGQQEIYHSRGVWQPVLANVLQHSCLQSLALWRRSLAGHSLQGQNWALPKWPCAHRCKTFLPVAALPQWELVQLLGL